MDYNEFVLKAQEDLAAAMPGKVITRESVDKLQGESYEGLAVRQEGSNLAVMLNMEAMYDRVEKGADYNQVLSDMLDIVDDNSADFQQGIADLLSDYRQAKDNLTVELVGQELNRDKLSDIPHYDMEDLSLIYRIDVSDHLENGGGRATVLVTNQMLERYNITPEQLHQDALENTSRKEPLIITSLGNVLLGLIGKDINTGNARDSGLYVSSNLSMMYGAATIAYPDFAEKAAKQLEGDFFILPSSVHELLLLRDDGRSDYRELEELVSNINATQVAPEERLSDRVYHYDSREKIFELAETFENRTRGREEKRHSVLDDLKSFGEKVEQQKPERVKPAPERGMAL